MKRTLTLLLSIVIALGVFVPAFAANITGIDENLPELDVKVAAPPGTYDKTRASQITGTLNGQSLITTDFRKETASIEWIIMIDTSKSLSEEHFKAQKDALLEVLKTLRETDRLVLYTFDDTVKQKLYGSESAA
ncbi:MAG: VWA domain-containing protein, partial [Clostridia bacterium]|nr:VWA domain-containing protein [Clostridia bacterium]